MRRALTGGWRVQVPGSLWESVEDDGSSVVFWNNELTVRGSSIIARRKAETPRDTPHRPVKPDIEFAPDKTGEGWLLHTIAETSGADDTIHVGFLTVWMEREELRPVAKRIARSLEYVPQRA
jgi:hypothetical protein